MENTKTSEACATKAVPEKEHRWLERFVGEWDVEGEAKMAPDQPSEKFQGTERVRSLGSLWILTEGEMPGVDAVTTNLTLGYDPHRKPRLTTPRMALQSLGLTGRACGPHARSLRKESAMKKVLDRKTLEKEAALWGSLKKASAQTSVRACLK
ncbi:MAG: DUF1579 family protein [Deltaproteobacteria bacterium]|nr:DUF1579 family protein [Deltaproteobacteria bacterium]